MAPDSGLAGSFRFLVDHAVDVVGVGLCGSLAVLVDVVGVGLCGGLAVLVDVVGVGLCGSLAAFVDHAVDVYGFGLSSRQDFAA